MRPVRNDGPGGEQPGSRATRVRRQANSTSPEVGAEPLVQRLQQQLDARAAVRRQPDAVDAAVLAGLGTGIAAGISALAISCIICCRS